MKRISFAIAVFVVTLLAVVSLCGMHCDERRQESKQPRRKRAESASNRSSQVSWESGIKFVMQWDDASKKLLFDGYPISSRASR